MLVQLKGIVRGEEFFEFQRKVWSRPAVAGYRQLVDTRGVARIDYEGAEQMRALADLAASMDPIGEPSRMAIVATDEYVLTLGRMYSAFRALNPRSTREVRTFADLEDALKWLKLPKVALATPRRRRGAASTSPRS